MSDSCQIQYRIVEVCPASMSDSQIAQLKCAELPSACSGVSILSHSNSSNSSWIVDSGATHHMTGMPSLFLLYYMCSGRDNIPISLVPQQSIKEMLPLRPTCFYHPNLLSISHIIKLLNCSVTFIPSYCIFQDLMTKKVIDRGYEKDGPYQLDIISSIVVPTQQCLVMLVNARKSNLSDLLQWHNRLSHPSSSFLHKLLLHFRSFLSLYCESCELSKHYRSIYPSSPNRSLAPFAIVICGGQPRLSLYLVTWVYLLNCKSDMPSTFKSLQKMVVIQFDTKLHIIRSNNGMSVCQGASYLILIILVLFTIPPMQEHPNKMRSLKD